MMKVLFLLSLLLVGVVGQSFEQLTATIQIINIAQPLYEASPDLYGLMYEEIFHQGAGGMHSELISNGFFQQPNTISPWTVQAIGGGSASECSMTVDSSLPHINEILPRALLLSATGSHSCGAINTGFSNAIGAPKGMAFNVSLYLHTTEDAAEDLAVTFELWDSSNNVIGTAEVTGLTTEWAQYQAHIVTTNTQSLTPIKFVAIVPEGAKVWLHGISLVWDQYWRGLPYIRKEVGDLLAEIKPATFRFPGGCFVEGDNMVDAYRWKEAIGPNIERKGNMNGVWGYWSPNFLGPFELLNFAEQLGAKPIWVVNSGASHGGYVNDTELVQWIQDAVDAVEFAIGDASTTWGAKRAAMGHAAPFNPNTFMIGIGNEEDFNNLNVGGLPLYKKSYPKFYSAIKAKFPNVVIVANNASVIVGGLDATDQIAELHDYNPADHYIMMREIMWEDWRPSKYMYVSEYGASCSSTAKYCPSPWAAAISEGAFLLGMEHHSDYVRMSCSETIGMQANFNSIGQTYGAPSYWVKWILAHEQGTHVIATEAYATSGWEMYASALATSRQSASTGGLELVLKVVNWGNYSYNLTVEGSGFPTGWKMGNVATSWIVMNGTSYNSASSFNDPLAVSARTQTNVALKPIVPGVSFMAWVPYSSITVAVIPLVKTSDGLPIEEPAPSIPIKTKPRRHRQH